MRILCENISESDKLFIKGKLLSVVNWTLTKHATGKRKELNISYEDIVDTIRYGSIIEIHNEFKNIRVLIRHYNKGICLVLTPKTSTIVTIYINRKGDNHDNLDRTLYSNLSEIGKLLKEL